MAEWDKFHPTQVDPGMGAEVRGNPKNFGFLSELQYASELILLIFLGVNF